ncbi:MAG TPA: protease inhibitor I42 family protein [Terriglobales bacterium]|nr:protease inhibitor I42 family protein [Terriglobales bacterium]
MNEAVSGHTAGDGAESLAFKVLSYAVLLSGLGSGIASAYLVISTYSPLPFWDEWTLVDRLATSGWSAGWLFAQHNEHRIFTTKLAFLLDVYLFHGTQVFLLALIFVVLLFHVALLSWSLRQLGGWRGSMWRAGTGLIAYAILCSSQEENLVWGFQLQFVLTAMLATLAVVSLMLLCRRPRTPLLLLCVAAATLATWSLANGMLLWPLLLVVALIMRIKASSVWTLLVAGMLNIAVYSYRYKPPPRRAGLPPLGPALKYCSMYFGSTWFHRPSGWLVYALGAACICVALVVTAYAFGRLRTRPLLLPQLSVLMLFCLGTAAVTAAGRLDFGLQQAGSSRYQSFALLFWVCLGLALLQFAAKNRKGGIMLSCLFFGLMLVCATQFRVPLREARWHQVRVKLVTAALLVGALDPAALAEGYPDPAVIARGAQYLKQHQLSIFGGAPYAQLGQTLLGSYRAVPADRCSGYVTSSQSVPAEAGQIWRVTGFAYDRERKMPVREVLAAFNGEISGFGTSITIPVRSGTLGPDADPERAGWRGWVRPPGPAETTELYAVVGKGTASVCPFAIMGAPASTVVVTDADNGKDIDLTSGQTLEVKLKSTAGTGYSWTVTGDPAPLKLTKTYTQHNKSASARAGASQSTVFQLNATSAGLSTLTLVYRRSWEYNVPPAKTFSVRVNVR